MNIEDTELALRCLGFASDLRRLDDLTPAQRARTIEEVGALLDLVAEVFLEPEQEPNGR